MKYPNIYKIGDRVLVTPGFQGVVLDVHATPDGKTDCLVQYFKNGEKSHISWRHLSLLSADQDTFYPR